MSQEVRTKLKETVRSTKELLIAIEEASKLQMRKNAPKVAHTLDKSFEEGSKAMTDFIATLDKKTGREQLELLRGYRYFLGRQMELVQGRITKIEGPRKSEETN